MDGSSKQPSSADITAMDGSSNNKTNSSNSKSNSSNKNLRTNNNDTESSGVPSSPLTSTTINDAGYCTTGPSTPMGTIMTCNSGTRNTSSFALPTPILPSSPGCGCIVMGPSAFDPEEITIRITPTTGGQFDLTVERNNTIENLKRIISKRLKVAKERICLLHRERQLRVGTLKENRLQDGSRLTLLPSVETGLMGQRPEQSVMQALESLNDSQVNDFLSGKAPLNLTMRLGDQMMLIQLQLSTVTPASPPAGSVGPSGVNTSSPTSFSPSSSSSSSSSSSASSSPCESFNSSIGNNYTSAATTPTSTNTSSDSLSMSTHRRSSDHLARSMRITKQNENSGSNTTTPTTAVTTSNTNSNSSNSSSPAGTPSVISSFSSTLHAASSCSTSISTATTTTNPCSSERSIPISQAGRSSPPAFWQRRQMALRRHDHSHRHHPHHHHHPRNRLIPPWQSSVQTSTTSTPINSLTEQTISSSTTTTPNTDEIVGASSTTLHTPPKKKLCTMGHHHSPTTTGITTDNLMLRSPECETHSQSSTNSIMGLSTSSKVAAATLDTRALAEASRNLTQKLKQLSSEEHARRRQGAIIESMHHHGKGVYSGTFSGTLNPALQDRHGRPKRDISTIIHILNDLLCATPAATASHYRHHHRHNSGRQQSSSTSSHSGITSATCSISSNGSFQDSPPGYSMEELSKENEATKGKMRRLRLVMEQRRAKRKERRQARAAPYTTQWAAVTPDPIANHDPTTSGSSSGSGTNSAEPQNEPELQPCSPDAVVA